MRPDIKAEWERLPLQIDKTENNMVTLRPETEGKVITARQFAALWRKVERAGMDQLGLKLNTALIEGEEVTAKTILQARLEATRQQPQVGGYDLAAVRRNAPKGKA